MWDQESSVHAMRLKCYTKASFSILSCAGGLRGGGGGDVDAHTSSRLAEVSRRPSRQSTVSQPDAPVWWRTSR